jgi:nucleotide-binding universal stress UspA family protein
MRILLAIDGSDSAQRAVVWCAEHAGALDADVVALHAVEGPDYDARFAPVLMPPLSDERFEEIRRVVQHDWCEAIRSAGVALEAEVVQGPAATRVERYAETGNFDLVVTGRRGHGAIGRALLGSTSSHLAHHLTRPLVIVP